MDIILFIIIGTAAFWAAIGTLILIFYFRSLSARQQGMLHEIENIAASQRRALERLHSLTHKVRILGEHYRREERVEAQAGDTSDSEFKAAKEDVLFLAGQGLDAKTIAKDLGIPSGEVELILDLEKFSKKK
jgi:hypothetical protein